MKDYQKASEKDREYYNRIAKVYFDRHDQPIQRYSTRVEVEELDKYIQENDHVLVVGVGGGREMELLLKKSCVITALDYSEEMIRIAKERWGKDSAEWHVADVHIQKPEWHGTFDKIICLAAVNYFCDIDAALNNINNYLKVGGVLVVSSINRLHSTEKKITSSVYTRILYSPEELTREFNNHGLKVIRVFGFRIAVDKLPSKFNSGKVRGGDLLLRFLIELDYAISKIISAKHGKFFWVIGTKNE